MNDTQMESETPFLCRCMHVTEGTVRKAISEQNLQDVDAVTETTRACGGCGSCWEDIQAVLDDIHGISPSPPLPADFRENAEDRARIERMLEGETGKLLSLNGLEVALLDVRDGIARMRFEGPAAVPQDARFLSLKKGLVRAMSNACGHRIRLKEEAPA